jgi:hypothetical protein
VDRHFLWAQEEISFSYSSWSKNQWNQGFKWINSPRLTHGWFRSSNWRSRVGSCSGIQWSSLLRLSWNSLSLVKL